ncbi:hypothetical protein BaRGS_00015922 [Batillaria attramentaria]|uniref:Glycine-rich domain-containing protein 1 n=1 Tax=Batillaria attramentaria TaxID=370345 RepID=A0ABD0L038_9CAEN
MFLPLPPAMLQDPLTYQFGLDLVKFSQYHLDFLKLVSSQPSLHNTAVLRQAIYRYEHLWLPLAAQRPNEALVAPLDVEWVWHVHLLSPVTYQKDCLNIVDTVVGHHVFSSEERAGKVHRSRELWVSQYPHEPFDIDLNASVAVKESPHRETKLTYDIMAATLRQKSFIYQVNLFIVPCYDIDLIWHTHQLHPLTYTRDMEAVLGHTFNHDDSVNDRNDDSKLNVADAKTRMLWHSTFGTHFATCGAMYRGEPPTGKLRHLSRDQVYPMFRKVATIRLETVDLRDIPDPGGMAKLKVSTSQFGQSRAKIASLKGRPPWRNVGQICFDTMKADSLKFQLIGETFLGCLGSSSVVAENEFSLLPVFSCMKPVTVVEQTLPLSDTGKPLVSFRAHVSHPRLGPIRLHLDVSGFERKEMIGSMESLWGPVPIMLTAISTGKAMLQCNVLHSLSLLQSAIHVFSEGKMFAVAHLVGSDTLPLPTQVN